VRVLRNGRYNGDELSWDRGGSECSGDVCDGCDGCDGCGSGDDGGGRKTAGAGMVA
jgi:hypothetical protein